VISTTDKKDKPPLARLLVVDDDSDNTQVIKLGLLKCGFLVDAFTNPEQALQKFKSNEERYCLTFG
jgi:CheY-like chemotaxis protein